LVGAYLDSGVISDHLFIDYCWLDLLSSLFIWLVLSQLLITDDLLFCFFDYWQHIFWLLITDFLIIDNNRLFDLCLFRGKQSLETICLLLAYKIKVWSSWQCLLRIIIVMITRSKYDHLDNIIDNNYYDDENKYKIKVWSSWQCHWQ